jgi:hypothetical protein
MFLGKCEATRSETCAERWRGGEVGDLRRARDGHFNGEVRDRAVPGSPTRHVS